MKLRLLPLVCAPVIALVGCSTADSASLGEAQIEHVSEIRDALARTDYRCSKWQELSQEGVCVQDGNGQVKFKIDGTPEDLARHLLDEQFPYADEVIVGKNWVGRCGTQEEGSCEAIADDLGARVQRTTRT